MATETTDTTLTNDAFDLAFEAAALEEPVVDKVEDTKAAEGQDGKEQDHGGTNDVCITEVDPQQQSADGKYNQNME